MKLFHNLYNAVHYNAGFSIARSTSSPKMKKSLIITQDVHLQKMQFIQGPSKIINVTFCLLIADKVGPTHPPPSCLLFWCFVTRKKCRKNTNVQVVCYRGFRDRPTHPLVCYQQTKSNIDNSGRSLSNAKKMYWIHGIYNEGGVQGYPNNLVEMYIIIFLLYYCISYQY